jgi:hypothetical protein
LTNLFQRRHTLLLKFRVADGKISSSNRMSGLRFAATANEPHVHAGRVGLDWRVDKVLETGVCHDIGVNAVDFDSVRP